MLQLMNVYTSDSFIRRRRQKDTFHSAWFTYDTEKITNKRVNLQSNQVKRTPQEFINEFIIQKLNPLLVVDFRLISAFLYV